MLRARTDAATNTEEVVEAIATERRHLRQRIQLMRDAGMLAPDVLGAATEARASLTREASGRLRRLFEERGESEELLEAVIDEVVEASGLV